MIDGVDGLLFVDRPETNIAVSQLVLIIEAGI